MSSNIHIAKKCEFCEKRFIARTVHTRFCSQACNSKSYERRKREEKVKVERMVEDLDLDSNELQVKKKTDGFWQIIDNYGDQHQVEQDAIAHFSEFGISERELKRHGCTFLPFVPTICNSWSKSRTVNLAISEMLT